MATAIHRAAERGRIDMGWFQAAYSFSFGKYHNPAHMGFGALRVLNDSTIQPGTGFPRHPHENMEIVTVQFAGDLEHTDSTTTRHLRANDVQAITAGTGVWHQDTNVAAEPARQLQIWVTPRTPGLAPASSTQHFDPAQRQNRWQLLVSPNGAEASLQIQQDTWLSRGVFQAGQAVNYPMHKADSGLYVFVLSGSLQAGEHRLEARDALLSSGPDAPVWQVEQTADLLVIEVPL